MIIKLRALERLASIIECEIPSLRCAISAGHASKHQKQRFPSVSLSPTRFSFYPDQATNQDPVTKLDMTDGPKVSVFNVGRWVGVIDVRVGAKTAYQRYELEHKLEQIFLGEATGVDASRPDAGACNRPGVLLADIPECHFARVAFELESDSWDNEMVFSNEWFSVLRVRAQIPALICKGPIHTIETLKLCLTEDLDTVVTSTATLPTDTETVQIADDGTITTI